MAKEAELDPESLVLTKATESRSPPPVLTLPLLPYQKEFLAWGISQELGPIRGGILAGACPIEQRNASMEFGASGPALCRCAGGISERFCENVPLAVEKEGPVAAP